MVDVLSAQLSWTQAHTNLINAYLSEKMCIRDSCKGVDEEADVSPAQITGLRCQFTPEYKMCIRDSC